MATVLRFNEGMSDFIQYDAKKSAISYPQELAVSILLDGKDVGWITADGKIATGRAIMDPGPVTFTETQWTAIALRAKEFKERCARLAQEQAQELPSDTMETPSALYAG